MPPGAMGGEGPSLGAGGETTTGEPDGAEAIDLTRLARLTHRQYDNSVSDALGRNVDVSSEFLPDPTFGGYDNNIQELAVSGRLGRDYRRAAEELASSTVEDAEALDELVRCDMDDDACSALFVEDLGRRLFRRPLSASESDRYEDLFARGPELVASGDDFRDGVRLVIEAMLQSPKFLYRVELSNEVDDDGAMPLDDFEIATRLSYLIWNTGPDDELLDLAELGGLDEDGVQEQAQRLLDDERAEEIVLDFHAQWLQLSVYEELSASLRQEPLEFVRQVTFEEDRGLISLLSASYTMANAEIAPFYGEELDGDEFVKLELDPTRRGGFLTQAGFLTSHAYSDASSPIHRGVFVLRQILCSDIPPPPGDVDFTLSEEAAQAPTKRRQVELQTEPPACYGCHSRINPVGFAFEHFDERGMYREQDGQEPVDASGSVSLDEGDFSFDGARDLIEQLAEAPAAHLCYARNWTRYALGRQSTSADEETISTLGAELSDDSFTVRDLLFALTQTPSFVARTVELQGR